MRTAFLVLLLGAAALAVAGCGATERSPAAQPVTSATTRAADPPKPPIAQAAVLRVARTAYGRALTDRRGFALYRFTHDRSPASTCYGACAKAWPPYVVADRPPGAGGRARMPVCSAKSGARTPSTGHLCRAPALLLRRRPPPRAGVVPGGPGIRRYVVRGGTERPRDSLTVGPCNGRAVRATNT